MQTNYNTLANESHVRVADAAYRASVTEFDNSLVILNDAEQAIRDLHAEHEALLARLKIAKANHTIAKDHRLAAEERMHRAYQERFPNVSADIVKQAAEAKAQVARARQEAARQALEEEAIEQESVRAMATVFAPAAAA